MIEREPSDFPFSPERACNGNGQVTRNSETIHRRIRRIFLKGGATIAALAAAGAGAYVLKPFPDGSGGDNWMADHHLTFSKRSEKLRQLIESFETRKRDFEERYRRTGELPDSRTLLALFREAEFIDLLREQPGEPVTSIEDHLLRPEIAAFQSGIQRQFAKNRLSRGMGADADSLEEIERTFPSVKALADMKLAIHAQIGAPKPYNSDCSSTFDLPLRNRLQCRSGTMEFLAQALSGDAIRLQPGEELVCIYRRGHVLPGLLTADGHITGFEMTKKGTAIVSFGPLQSLHGEVGIARAKDILTQSAFNSRMHEERVWLKAPELTARTAQEQRSAAGRRPLAGRRDRFAFGENPLPRGKQGTDLEMEEYPAFSAREYEWDSGIYEAADGILRRMQEIESVIRRMPPEDQEIARAYTRHFPYFYRAFDAQAGLLNPILRDERILRLPSELIEANVNRCTDIMLETSVYFRQHDLAAKRVAALQAFERNRLPFPEHDPLSIALYIQNNINAVIQRRIRALKK